MKLTDWLSIYAAALSTAIFAWKLLQERPRFKVIVTHGVEGKSVGVNVTVKNKSSRTIHLAGASILYRNRAVNWRDWLRYIKTFRRIPMRLGWVYSAYPNVNIDESCPVAVEAYDSHCFLIQESTVEEISSKALERKFVVVVQDRLWNKVYSNVFVYDWSKVLNSGA